MTDLDTTTPVTAAPAKLRNGEWGARPSAPVRVGDTITIVTRAGKRWDARVTDVSPDGTLCSTESITPKPATRVFVAEKFYGARRGGYRRACKTDGNCSSIGSGRSCGGHDCDGY